MLAFFSKKTDTLKQQETLQNVDIMILDLLKKKENKNKKEDKNKIKKIYKELNSFISN